MSGALIKHKKAGTIAKAHIRRLYKARGIGVAFVEHSTRDRQTLRVLVTKDGISGAAVVSMGAYNGIIHGCKLIGAFKTFLEESKAASDKPKKPAKEALIETVE